MPLKELVKMKKELFFLGTAFSIILFLSPWFIDARPLSVKGGTSVVIDGGSRGEPFLITLSSSVATLIIPSGVKRSAAIQNPISSGFSVAIGTHSAFTAFTARIWELGAGAGFVTNAMYPIYGIISPGGSGISVIGVIEKEEGD